MTKENLVYGRDKLAFVTEVEKDGVHSHYILYREEDESFIPIDQGNDLDALKKEAREEHHRCVLRKRLQRQG